MEPPVNPPKLIPDPEDKKPEDWVDEAKIPDATAEKPEDWDEDAPKEIEDQNAEKPSGWSDDEPPMIPDSAATMPSDWDEEEDGEWEAPKIPNPKCSVGCGEWKRPMIANPEYKGKWQVPMVDNPEYKGEWKPREIDNPQFFVEEHPSHFLPIGAVAIEIWTMTSGIVYDNLLLSHDEEAALNFGEATWRVKAELEKALEKDASAGGIFSEVTGAISSSFEENPIFTVGLAMGLVLMIAAVIYFTCFSGSTDEPEFRRPSQAAKPNEAATDDAKPEAAEQDSATPASTSADNLRKRTAKASASTD
jgi:calnexin